MEITSWAEREIELLKEVNKEEEWGYTIACAESALKALKALAEDGHSGMSISITKSMLNRLIDCKPLTAIEDVPEVWNEISDKEDTDYVECQCSRMPSLSKKIHEDGSIIYKDNGRLYCVNKNNPDVSYSCGTATRILNELHPITLPYYPPTKRYKMICEDFLVDAANGDFDTQGFFELIHPDGTKEEVNRFFAEKDGHWVEITKEEYEERRNNKITDRKGC